MIIRNNRSTDCRCRIAPVLIHRQSTIYTMVTNIVCFFSRNLWNKIIVERSFETHNPMKSIKSTIASIWFSYLITRLQICSNWTVPMFMPLPFNEVSNLWTGKMAEIKRNKCLCTYNRTLFSQLMFKHIKSYLKAHWFAFIFA